MLDCTEQTNVGVSKIFHRFKLYFAQTSALCRSCGIETGSLKPRIIYQHRTTTSHNPQVEQCHYSILVNTIFIMPYYLCPSSPSSKGQTPQYPTPTPDTPADSGTTHDFAVCQSATLSNEGTVSLPNAHRCNLTTNFQFPVLDTPEERTHR